MNVVFRLPLDTSHSHTLPSRPPLAKIEPSGENDTEYTSPSWPLSMVFCLPLDTYHNRTLLSRPPLAKIEPSGENDWPNTHYQYDLRGATRQHIPQPHQCCPDLQRTEPSEGIHPPHVLSMVLPAYIPQPYCIPTSTGQGRTIRRKRSSTLGLWVRLSLHRKQLHYAVITTGQDRSGENDIAEAITSFCLPLDTSHNRTGPSSPPLAKVRRKLPIWQTPHGLQYRYHRGVYRWTYPTIAPCRPDLHWPRSNHPEKTTSRRQPPHGLQASAPLDNPHNRTMRPHHHWLGCNHNDLGKIH